MNDQPEALRLADELENGECFDVGSTSVAYGWMHNDPTSEAADELRRLHEDNVYLKEALWAAANKIEKLAFQTAAPNAQTPEFMMLAVSIRQIVSQEQPR